MIHERVVETSRGPAIYLEAGAGWPLILLHAFPLSAWMWRAQLESVPEGWRFLAPHLRGFGGSPLPVVPPTMDGYAADVEALMDALGVESAVIGGLSMGGYVTFALYRRAPERFTGIVLADTKSEADTAEGRAGRQAMVALVRSQGPAAVVDSMLPKLLSAKSREDPEMVRRVRELSDATSQGAIEHAIGAMMNRPDSTPGLPALSMPTVVIVGEDDRLTPREDAERMQRAMPRSRLVVLPGAGHLSNLEAPDLFSAALADFPRLLTVTAERGGGERLRATGHGQSAALHGRITRWVRTLAAIVVLVLAWPIVIPAQRVFTPAEGADPLHAPLDQILDANVRDGLVYYRAVRSVRAGLDRYVASLDVAPQTYAGWSRERQMAFWLNAYNAFVLQSVIDAYPIRARSAAFPATSVKQIPGMFEQTRHRAAGRQVTLDDIEKSILPEFKEPRLYLALGRGSIGSGRLRSEAYTGQRLKRQLETIQADFVGEQQMIQIDRLGNQVSVTSIVSWRDAEFVTAYDTGATGPFAQRSPVERALMAFVLPHVLPLERELLQKNQFKVTFLPFDWRLNDLSNRSE